jgi:hypothetical protein
MQNRVNTMWFYASSLPFLPIYCNLDMSYDSFLWEVGGKKKEIKRITQ